MKNMAAWEQARLTEYIEQKVPSFEKLVSHFQDDTVSLAIRAERFDKNNAYRVELIFEIPSRLIVGVEDSHSIEKAVDLAKDRLIKQLKKHEDQLKNRGKLSANFKRSIKQLGSSRTHQGVKEEEEMLEESMLSSTFDS
jgi:ribosomal subunit interface protein